MSLENLLTQPSAASIRGEPKYIFENGVSDSQRMSLCVIRDRLLSCFNDHVHSESFWDNAMLQVRCSFATSLLSFRLDPKERSVIDGVVMPMLRMFYCTGFRAHLLVEDRIPSTAGKRGRKAEVYIVIQLVDIDTGTTIKLVPLEAHER